MRYLLLIYEEPPATPPTDEEWAAIMPAYNAFGAWTAERGWMLGGEALQDVSHGDDGVGPGRPADRDGRAVRGDQEQLGGRYYLFHAPSLRRRHQAAARPRR